MKFRSRSSNPSSPKYWFTILHGKVPSASTAQLAQLMSDTDLELHISKPRSTKLGHYRPPFQGATHTISINNDLSPERFLLTLVHELAHLHNFLEHQNKVAPHGPEWKQWFQLLMQPYLNSEVFPDEVLPLLIRHLQSPKATSCVDKELHRTFESLDGKELITLDDLEEGQSFRIPNGRTFVKGIKKRTRHLCQELPSGRKYYIHGAAPVEEIYELKGI